MAVKTPVKATFTGSDVTGLAEYQAADFIGVADGGSGAVTFTAGILTADGTNAFSTVTAPSGTIVGTSDTQTLTNKTINTASNTITIVEADISDLGSYITASSTDTLTNKTISLTSNTISGTTAEFNTALSDGSFATLAGTETLTNKTISGSSNTLSNIGNASLTNSTITVTDGSTSTATSLGGTITFAGTSNEIEVGESSGTITVGLPSDVTIGNNLTVTGDLTVNGTTTTVNSTTIEVTNSFTFEGSTADGFETVLGVIDPTADRTINLPNVSGTVITSGNLSDISSLDATSIADGSISNTEFQFLNGVSSNIQTQLDAKATNAFAIAQAVALG